MENVFALKNLLLNKSNKKLKKMIVVNENENFSVEDVFFLAKAKTNVEYIIKNIITENIEVRDFLFTLGCYEGEKITIVSILGEQYVIVVKDARYSINKDLAECIVLY